MAMTNHERVGKALTQLQAGLSPFIERELKAKYGQEWAPEGLKMLRAKMGSWQGRSEADPLTSADDAEVGGLRGREALNRLRNAIGRVESSWRPASAEEGFEIVRRRLFEPMTEREQFVARDNTARAFADLYRSQHQEFPPECRGADYEQRLKAAYPIHPEVFDRLYEDWSTLLKFQRTRGILRLMAAVIHSLWERGDQSPLILPASLPLDDQRVQFELTRYLSDNWPPVIAKDVDGPNSLPLRLDGEAPNFGKHSACRRVARAIYLSSAPTAGAANRGSTPRRYRNTLAFLAADKTRLADLEDAVRRYLAWRSIVDEAETLDLTPHQKKQAITQRDSVAGMVTARLPETYQWLLVPGQSNPAAPVTWQAIRLIGAIQDGLKLLTWEQDAFAYAESYDETTGRYRGLQAGQIVLLNPEALTGLLVKPERARRQLELERPSVTPPGGGGGATPPEPGGDKAVGPGGTGPKPRPRPRRFHGAVKLEAARTGRDAGKVADEVLAHLVGLVGAEVTVTLEISAWAPDGVPEHVVRTVTENCRTLKFEDQGFEME